MATTPPLPPRHHPAHRAVRTAGALVLLYGLPVGRVTTLQQNNIQHDPTGRTWLRHGGHRLQLPPAIATLILNQRDSANTVSVIGRSHPKTTMAVFPGGFPANQLATSSTAHYAATSAYTYDESAAPPSPASPPTYQPPYLPNSSTSTSTLP